MNLPVLPAKVLRERSDEHLSRKFFHLLSGTVITILFVSVFSRVQSIELICAGSAFLICLDFLRLVSGPVQRLVLQVYGPLMRAEEQSKPSAQLFYVLGLSFAIIALPRVLAVQAILTLAWMDPVAGMIGLRYGRHPWASFFGRVLVDSKKVHLDLSSKTIEGSFAGFLVAFLAGIIAWTGPWAAAAGPLKLWWPSAGLVLLFSMVGGFVAVLAEAWPTQWDDNINIPFWTGISLWALATFLGVPLRYL